MNRFKITYQDRTVNKHFEIFEAPSWEDAVIMAFSRKKAEWKLLTIECLADVLTRDDKIEFSSWNFIAELEKEDLDDRLQWPKENPCLKKKE